MIGKGIVEVFYKRKKEYKQFNGVQLFGYRCRVIIYLKILDPSCYKVLDIWNHVSNILCRKPRITTKKCLELLDSPTDIKLYPVSKFEQPEPDVWEKICIKFPKNNVDFLGAVIGRLNAGSRFYVGKGSIRNLKEIDNFWQNHRCYLMDKVVRNWI